MKHRVLFKYSFLIFCTAFAARCLLIYLCRNNPDAFLTPDSYDYMSLGSNFAMFFGFNINSTPEIFRTPGYPMFLSFFNYFLLNPVVCIVIFQALIDSLTCVILYQFAMLMFDYNDKANLIALVAALFQALCLNSIVFSCKVLSETLFTFIVVIFMFYIYETISGNEKNHASFISGFFAGVLCLIRAAFLPFGFLCLILVPMFSRKIRYALLFMIPFFVLIFFWCFRNYMTADYCGFSTVSAINMYRYNACAVEADEYRTSFAEQQSFCDYMLSKCNTEAEKARFAMSHGGRKIMSSLPRYIVIHLKTSLNGLLPSAGDFFNMLGCKVGNSGTLSVLNTKGLTAAVKHYFNGNLALFYTAIPIIMLLAAKYILCIAGFLTVFHRRNTHKTKVHLFFLLMLLYFIFVSGPASTPRFRVPIEPIISLYAALGLFCYRKIN